MKSGIRQHLNNKLIFVEDRKGEVKVTLIQIKNRHKDTVKSGDVGGSGD